MADQYDPELIDLLRRVNRARWSEVADELEATVEALQQAARKLAVYGSLAPGRVNHHVLADHAGTWEKGIVRGELHPDGWGQPVGYPAMRWNPDGQPIAVDLLSADGLPGLWARLDRFEGKEYRRILIPVETESGIQVANIYELRSRLATDAGGRSA